LQFTSRYAALQMPVRDEVRRYFDDGRSVVLRPALLADFAEMGVTETYHGDPSAGFPMTYDAIRGGGFFDSDIAAERHGWNDEEKAFVEARLLDNAKTDGDCELYVVKPPDPPWPTYPKMRTDSIVKMARELGYEQEAVIYEERTLKREAILGPLREDLQQREAEDELTVA
jgi:hypothetical protein